MDVKITSGSAFFFILSVLSWIYFIITVGNLSEEIFWSFIIGAGAITLLFVVWWIVIVRKVWLKNWNKWYGRLPKWFGGK